MIGELGMAIELPSALSEDSSLKFASVLLLLFSFFFLDSRFLLFSI